MNTASYSSIGIFLTITYFICLVFFACEKRLDRFRWYMFNGVIMVSLFTNIGICIFNWTFNNAAMIFYLLSCLIAYICGQQKFTINKSVISASFIVVGIIILGLIHLILMDDLPQVIPMDVIIDDVFLGNLHTEKATFKDYNIYAFKYFFTFVVLVLFSYDYLSSKKYVLQVLTNIRNAYFILFLWFIFEFLINNFIDARVLRDVILSLFGEEESFKVQYPISRYGDFVGVSALFSEQSYISIVMVLYVIEMIMGIKNNKEAIIHFLSILACILSGSSTGIFLLPIGLFICYREFVPNSNKIKHDELLRFSMILFLGLCVLITFVANIDNILAVIDVNVDKLGVYISGEAGGDANSKSAATRTLGNLIALNAFMESPLLGVGLGTTRGYGVIVGALANFGVIGIVAILYFIKVIFNISLKNKKMVLCIAVGYLSIVLSVWYIYMPALIPFYAAFNRDIVHYSRQ